MANYVGQIFNNLGKLLESGWTRNYSKDSGGYGFGDFFNDTGNIIQGAWNDWTGNTANSQNIAYQKEYNAEVFNRADTQYQRTVADLRSSGLSAQLAAGSPSTVAGASAAPQRTVGNESQAIERLVGLVNAIKSTNSSVQLQSAEADKAKADAVKSNAEAIFTSRQSAMYQQKTEAEMVLNQAYTGYYNSLTFLQQKEGERIAEKIDAQIQSLITSNKYNEQLTKNAVIQGNLLNAQIFNTQASTALTNKQRELIGKQMEHYDKSMELLTEQIATEIVNRNHLEASTAKLVQETVYNALQYDVLAYNYEMSMSAGYRTTDSVPSNFWQSLQSSINSITKSGLDRLKGFKEWNTAWTPWNWVKTGVYPWSEGFKGFDFDWAKMPWE